MRDRLLKFFKSDKHLWWTVTIFPGVYSILYLYTNNFTLVNSWYQLMWCVLVFVALPIAEILVLDFAFKKWLPKWRPHLYWCYLLINFALILSYIVYGGWRYKALALVFIITLISAFFVAVIDGRLIDVAHNNLLYGIWKFPGKCTVITT